MLLIQASSQDGLFWGLTIVCLFVALSVFAAFHLWNRTMQHRAKAAIDGQFGENWPDASQNRRKILFYSVATMSVITVCVGAIATSLLYNASFEQQRQRLVEMASAQARLIEAVARFDRIHSQSSEGGSTAATISQIVDAHQHQHGLGRTGEFTLARLDGDEMTYLLAPRHVEANQSLQISYRGSELGEPMRRALAGQSGTIIATDYRGELVLAAYEPVDEIELAIVAKIDLDEIRRPFMRAASVGLGVATLLILGGGLVLVWVNTPLINRVEDRERRLHAIVSNVFDAVFTVDSQGVILSFNQAAEAIFGYTAAEVEGLSVSSLVHDPNFRVEIGRENLTPERHEVLGRRKNGDIFPMDIAFNPVARGDSPSLVGIARDITERRESEIAMQEARQAAEEAKEAAETANRAKSDFLSHMSHELRTPLNGILGYAQILRRDSTFTTRQRVNIDAIVNCGDHLLALINDVLDLSSIEAGRLEVDKTAFNLHDLLMEVTDIVRERANHKGVTFTMNVADEVPQRIITDAVKLRQILVNLLGNAVKFTDNGEVTLHVIENPLGSLQIDVVDTGVGMTDEEITHIFDPFKQVEAGKAAGGTGLGLAITKRLTKALGATVVVQSQKGIGSTFTVVIPLVQAKPEAWPEPPKKESSVVDYFLLAEGQEWTILIADDRDTNRNVLQGMLEPAGFATRLASDGDDALEILRTHDDVDLVLMDIRMPRVSGVEAIKRIREDTRLRDTKVIAVTASVFPEFRQKAIDAGFDDFLAKPFRIEELMGKLEKHLDIEMELHSIAQVVSNIEFSPSELDIVSASLATRLRKAVSIKNLTAIADIAAILCADSSTAKTGHNLTRLLDAFDFAGLEKMASELENQNGHD